VVAFTGLVADGTVQRMIDEQKLQHAADCLLHLGELVVTTMPSVTACYRRVAVWGLLLYQACGTNRLRSSLMVAITGNLNAQLFGGLMMDVPSGTDGFLVDREAAIVSMKKSEARLGHSR
jgi:hypothetical protein